MPVAIFWVQSPHIVAVEYQRSVSRDDLTFTNKQLLGYAQQHPLYILVDLQQVTSLPRNLVNLSYNMQDARDLLEHPNIRAFAFVKVSTTVRLALETILRDHRYDIFADRAEAVAYLREQQARDKNASPSDDG
jgi:hypothetical protein